MGQRCDVSQSLPGDMQINPHPIDDHHGNNRKKTPPPSPMTWMQTLEWRKRISTQKRAEVEVQRETRFLCYETRSAKE